MKTRCLIVDDEPLAGKLIEDYLGMIPGAEIVACVNTPLKALELITPAKTDLVFLDIQMPGLSGLELLRSLPDPPLVILITAFAEYALEGYAFEVVDYLLKPVPFDRFLLAYNRGVERLRQRRALHDEPESAQTGGQADKWNADNSFSKSQSQPSEKSYLFLKSGYKSVRVGFEEILYVEAMGEYVAIHIPGRKFLKKETMKTMEGMLPSDAFLRIHKSYLVAVGKVHAFYGNTVEVANQQLPVGRAFREQVQRVFS